MNQSNYTKEGEFGILYCKCDNRTTAFKDFCDFKNKDACNFNRCFRDLYFNDRVNNPFSSGKLNKSVYLGKYLLLAAED